MSFETWVKIDEYFKELMIPDDPALANALRANVDSGLPLDYVSPNQGMFLHMLARINGAKRILEVGTLAGYSTIWLARALPSGGNLVTLELKTKNADIARKNFEEAGLSDIINLRVGDAADGLQDMIAAGEAPFDFIFLDADKRHHDVYFDYALKLSRPGTIIIADNVVRNGDIITKSDTDPRVQGIRRMLEKAASLPNVMVTALQTVGEKGHDGFAMILVK